MKSFWRHPAAALGPLVIALILPLLPSGISAPRIPAQAGLMVMRFGPSPAPPARRDAAIHVTADHGPPVLPGPSPVSMIAAGAQARTALVAARQHTARAAYLHQLALAAIAARAPPTVPAAAPAPPAVSAPAPVASTPPPPASSGIYSYAALEALWVSAGGPAAAEASAATIAECESGGNPQAYNPSGASGLWQILGAPSGWTGSTDWFIPAVNAAAAVAKFTQAHDTFAPWVCQA